MEGNIPSAYLVRKVLEEENTWSKAVQRLSNTDTSTSIYYIVSGLGPNEGVVIEKDMKSVHETRYLSESYWFLV